MLIRRHGRAAILEPFPRGLRPIAAAIMACSWPIQSLRDAWRDAQRLAPGSFPDRSRGALVSGAWRAALSHNVTPIEYFAYRVPDSPGTSHDAWVYQTEMSRLLRALSTPEARRLADDKLAFAGFCQSLELRIVPTLGRIAPGDAGDAPDEPPGPRIVIKPRRGSNGRLITLWQRGEGGWHEDGVQPVRNRAWGDLVGELRSLARAGEEMLIQPALPPHPAIADLAGAGAPAARIVTGLWPNGSVEALSASFAVPLPGSATSNGGPRRMVELESGRLLPMGPGRANDIFGDSDDCPELDARELPGWSEAVEMTLAGHRAFPSRAVLLGWDVAFTPDGPMLIEVNMGLSFFLEQYESLVPAGAQRGATLIAAWLE